jgi:hypothetical protein
LSFLAVVFGVGFQSYRKFAQGCLLKYTYLLNRQTKNYSRKNLELPLSLKRLSLGSGDFQPHVATDRRSRKVSTTPYPVRDQFLGEAIVDL